MFKRNSFGLLLGMVMMLSADGGSGGGGGGAPEGGAPEGGTPKPDASKTEPPTSISPEEAAKQVEAAKAAAKAEAKAEYERELAAKLEESRTEAEKLAKMSSEEKEKFEMDKRLKALEGKEKEIALRELKAETAKSLADKGLPAEVLDLVIADDAETTAKRTDTFKSVFDKAVQAAVEDRLKGKAPSSGGGGGKSEEDQAREKFAAALKGGMR